MLELLMKCYKVTSSQSTRLDLELMKIFPEFSRTTIKNLILDGHILLNENPAKPNTKVSRGDRLVFKDFNIRKLRKNKISSFKINLKILYEDNDLIAVDKPAGIVSHPDSIHRSITVLNGILYLLKGKNYERVRLLHRLDKATSGVILATKNLSAHNYYSNLFAKNKVSKEYLAVVKGDFNNVLQGRKDLVVSNYMKYAKQGNSLSKSYVVTKEKGLRAITKFRLLEVSNGYSLVSVKPLTGRTHQIRAHLSILGYPIVGDLLYGGENHKRLMLHAYRIVLKKMNGSTLTVTADLPESF
jgi:23S rRNA pseudouridine1911/1915/1917 synthase